ncbi:twin-arginine translocation signal domain-containing protein [Streptomyces sp. NPDC052236]|uniref:twin-arginine translocation signal domain-containing protein n=1 Tax=Streptomyces sp. NPDC052236 TaxID=3365686 RepID=UPI0037D94C01
MTERPHRVPQTMQIRPEARTARPLRSRPPAAAWTRRGFLKAAGTTLAGAMAAFGLSAATLTATEPPVAGASGTAGGLTTARVRAFHALADALVSTQGTADARSALRSATSRLTVWYEHAGVQRRQQIDEAIDSLEDGLDPGSFAEQDTRVRLLTLAQQLDGPAEIRVVTALGFAAGALSSTYQTLNDAPAAGQLYARMIRAVPAQRGPGRTPRETPEQTTTAAIDAAPTCAA